MTKSRFAVVLALSLCAVAISAPLVRAESVRIQPALVEERLVPGSAYSGTLRVTNLGPDARTFYLFVKDVASVDDTGKPTFTSDENPLYGMQKWISLSAGTLEVPGGATREVPFTITAPEGAAPGGHFAGIFVSLRAVRPNETGVGVGYEVGTIVSMRIAGDAIEEAVIREFSTERGVYETPNVPFLVRMENLGNVLVRPRGPIQVTDAFGRQADPVVVNEEGAALYPGTKRDFTAGWSSDDPFAIGRYQATLSLAYGEDKRDTITATVSFWVLPTKIIAGILIGILVLVILFVLGLRWYIRKRVAALGGGATATGRPEALLPPARLLAATIAAILFALLLLFAVFLLLG